MADEQQYVGHIDDAVAIGVTIAGSAEVSQHHQHVIDAHDAVVVDITLAIVRACGLKYVAATILPWSVDIKWVVVAEEDILYDRSRTKQTEYSTADVAGVVLHDSTIANRRRAADKAGGAPVDVATGEREAVDHGGRSLVVEIDDQPVAICVDDGGLGVFAQQNERSAIEVDVLHPRARGDFNWLNRRGHRRWLIEWRRNRQGPARLSQRPL